MKALHFGVKSQKNVTVEENILETAHITGAGMQ